MTFTKKQMDTLSTFDGPMRPFSTVLDSRFLRPMTSRDIDVIAQVWADANGLKEYRVQHDCGNCAFNFIEMVGRAYRAQVVSDAIITAQKKAEAKEAKSKDKSSAESSAKSNKSNGSKH